MMSIGVNVAALALTGLLSGSRVTTEQKDLVAAGVGAAEQSAEKREQVQTERDAARRDREDRLYEEGQDAL
jgi:hypothetical protein